MRKINWNFILFGVALVLGGLFGFIDPTTAFAAGCIGAVVAVKSGQITNADALPAVINVAQLADGRTRHKRGLVAVTNGDSIASIYRVIRVKSNDMVAALLLDCTAITGAIGDIGLYRTSADGGAVVDVDFFASAQSMASALAATNVTREANAGPATVANMEKCIWEQLGLTADPQVEYDVAITLTAAATASGTAALSAFVVGRT